jgi:hypothetical protein
VESTGARVVMDLMNIFRFDDDGRLIEEFVRTDHRSFLRQLGAKGARHHVDPCDNLGPARRTCPAGRVLALDVARLRLRRVAPRFSVSPFIATKARSPTRVFQASSARTPAVNGYIPARRLCLSDDDRSEGHEGPERPASWTSWLARTGEPCDHGLWTAQRIAMWGNCALSRIPLAIETWSRWAVRAALQASKRGRWVLDSKLSY